MVMILYGAVPDSILFKEKKEAKKPLKNKARKRQKTT